PLVIATCTEFSVLILARYLEERQRGLVPQAATDMASSRTGRAFFTSAATTIGGFAVLIGSSMPLLRDFGIIVTMNVAVALLAALVVLPPLLVWADEKGLLTTKEREGAVQLAATERRELLGTAVGVAALAACAVGLFLAADKTEGTADAFEYTAQALPTTTLPPTTTTDAPAEPPPTTVLDLDQFGTEPVEGVVPGLLFTLLTEAGADPRSAVCTGERLLEEMSDAEWLQVPGIAEFTPEAMEPVIAQALECGATQNQIDIALANARGEEPPPVEETPDTTAAPTTTALDLDQFGTEPVEGVVPGALFTFLTGAGADPRAAVCAGQRMLDIAPDAELLAIPGFITFDPEPMEPVIEVALGCGIDQATIDAALTTARGG
ncbi:MAG: MMPL family transporter, partial [Acidimicrobiales bacterium]|nr:MMPL family transporter [Acidimicrobiales bacterium]